MFDIVKQNESLNIRYNKKAGLIIIIPICSLILAVFVALSIFVSDLALRIVFILTSIAVLAFAIACIISTVKFQLIIDKSGVLYNHSFQKKFMGWDEINEIAICCSRNRNVYGYYHPQTSIYFSKRHLTKYEKTNFYDKKLPTSVKIICFTQQSSNEFDSLLHEISYYVKMFSNTEIINFNSQELRLSKD